VVLLSRGPWLCETRKLAGDRREGEWSLLILSEDIYAGVEGEEGASTGRSGKMASERDNRRIEDGTEVTLSGRRPTCMGVDIIKSILLCCE
jgi:hypothetical protein